MSLRLFPILCTFTVILLLPASTLAQATPKAFSTSAYALDASSVKAGNRTIDLWGIEAATQRGTPENLRARAYLDDLIGPRPIRCIPMGGLVNADKIRAQCLNFQEKDIGMMLIATGLVVVNRADVIGSDVSDAYLEAERRARIGNVGVWATLTSDGKKQSNDQGMASLLSFGNAPLWAVGGTLLIIPLLGFLIIGMIIHMGFRQLITLQKYQIAGTQKREKQLKEREKYVVAAALEGEINTNRAKLDAFMIIYEELLKSLRDRTKTPKYQRAGDIIHDKPALSRTVYDSNMDKLDLLGPSISSELSRLYAMIDPNPDYRTLEPETPIERAMEIVDHIVREAEKMSEPMDKVSGALSVIVRDRRGATALN